jgi:hypothetical protein
MADLLQSMVKKVVVETEWLPTIELDDPFKPVPKMGPGAGSIIGRALKPRITLYSAYATEPLVMSPYGAPMPNWPILKTALIGLAGLSAVALVAHYMKRGARLGASAATPGMSGLARRRRSRRRGRR